MSDQGVTAEDLKPTEDTEEKPTKDLEYTELKLDDDDDELGLIDNVDIEDIPLVDELRSHVDELKTADLLDYIDRYQQKIEVYLAQKVKLKQSKRENVKKHRGSVIDLHNRMFKKLIDTESEQKTELEHTKDRVLELETEVKKFKFTEQDAEAVAKGDANAFKTGQIETLLDENAKLEKKARDLETKLKDKSSVIELEKMKHEKTHDAHRKSISTLHTNMFKKLLDAEDDFEDKMDKVNEELVQTQRELQLEKMRTVQSDKLRRDSIQTVHNNMLTKLLDAQAEHDEREERHQKEVNELKAALRKEILRGQARAEKDAADREDVDSDMSDLETEKETRHTPKHKERFDDLWNEADEPAAEVERLKRQIVGLEKQLKEANVENEEIERTRKDSIHNLHNNMFQKLLDAEFEYEEEIERLHQEKEEFNEKIQFYEEAFKKMNSGDGATIVNPTEIIQLREEIQQKNEEIEENKQQIFQLKRKIEALQVKVENEQKQRRGSVSFLSKQMMAKLLEAEEENEEQRQEFKSKLQQLEKELGDSKEMAFNSEKTRRNSVTKVSQTMFHKLLVAEQTKKQMTQQYTDRIKELERQLAVEKLKNETVSSEQDVIAMDIDKYKNKAQTLQKEIVEYKEQTEADDRVRRESMSKLQNNYWEKLLDAEDSHFEQINKLQQMVRDLRIKNEDLVTSKLNLIAECDKQMRDLRAAVYVYNKQSSSSWF
eukprot:26791_1